jgi:hypothetical protein
MRALSRVIAFGAVLVAPAAVGAQVWSSTAPTVTVSATVAQMRQFRTDNVVNLSFGTDGVTPGVAKTVTPSASSAASGTGAKVEIRFNTGTKVTVVGSALTATINSTTYTMNPTYSCAVANDQSGTGLAAFPTTCAAGYEWLSVAVTGMMFRTVLVGATLSAMESDTKPAGTYTGTITLVLSSSSS